LAGNAEGDPGLPGGERYSTVTTGAATAQSDAERPEYRACRSRADGEADRRTPDVASTVAATIRTVAEWISNDKDRDLLHSAAQQVEHNPGPDSICCPLCEEITCDDGCPMEVVRRG
jgi:hypothetical protein